jgi:TolB-like protein
LAERDDIEAGPALPDKPSIAVLAFKNMSADPEQEYFSDGITEDIITELSKISGLFVIARHSSFIYKEKPVTTRQVGRELGVRYVLEGSVRRAGNRLRITAQLIDSATDHHLWAERYDRDLTDIFAVQDEITEEIVAALEVKLTAGEQKQAAGRYTDNLEAYDYFLRGRAYQLRVTKEATAGARKMFERAIELDPSFAGAYALLSHVHYQDWRHEWSEVPNPLDRALAAAEKAVALDDSLPLAHTYLAWIHVWKKQHEQAIAEGERAIAFDHNFAEGYAYLGNILNFAGKPEEAVAAIERAMRLDPHYPPNYLVYLARGYDLLGKREDAIAALRKCITLDPDRFAAHQLLASIYGQLGRKEEAEVEVAEMLRIRRHADFNTSLADQREKIPYKDQAVLERYLEGLRKAGLPE